MPLTLLEANKSNDGDLKRSGVIQMFAEASDIVRAMPFMDIPGNSYSYDIEGKLPGVAFRGYNEGYPESTGIVNPESERLRIAGGDLDVDKAMIKTHGPDIRSRQEAMKIKAMSLYMADRIINGDSVANFKEFDGLRVRVRGQQLLAANQATPNANAPLSLDALDAAIDQVDNPTHLIMPKVMRRRLSNAAKQSNLGGDINVEKDEFGFRVMFYNDLPILIADTNHIGQRIIDFNEAGPGGGTDSSSVYVANFGDGYISGIQNGLMEVRDIGELETKPTVRTRVEWLVGLTVMHSRALARVWGIQDAAVTA